MADSPEKTPTPSYGSWSDDSSKTSPTPARYGGDPSRGEPDRRSGIAFYLFALIAAYGCIKIAPLDPWAAVAASALTAGAFAMAFSRANPRLVALALIGFTLATYYTHPHLAVLWMVSAAMAGGAMAWLLDRQAPEDNFFFIPLAVSALAFWVLIGLADALKWAPTLDLGHQLLEGLRLQWEAEIQRIASSGANDSTANPLVNADQMQDSWKIVRDHFGPFIVTATVGFWALAMWAASRLARQLIGRLDGRRTAIMLFRIRTPYIFLLILGLILEILSSLYAWGALVYVAWPLFAWFAMGCFFEGLGVLLFMVALRRASGRRRSAMVMGVAGLVLLLLRPLIGLLVGLADIWFDFRKLRLIDETLDLEG